MALSGGMRRGGVGEGGAARQIDRARSGAASGGRGASPRRGRAALLAASLGVLTLALSACPEDGLEYRLSWRFAGADGCDAAGVSTVTVRASEVRSFDTTFECGQGVDPATVELGPFEEGIVVLKLWAYDVDGRLRYEAQGRVALDASQAAPAGLIMLEPAAP